MDDFAKNLEFLIGQLRPRKMEEIAAEIGIGRSTLSRLKTGNRPPTAQHLALIANYAGLADPEQLNLPHADFKAARREGHTAPDSPLYGLRIVAANLGACKAAEEIYRGQYVVFTPSTRPGKVVASLLEIGTTTSNGISVSLINPYNGHESEFLAFEYRGFMVPVAEYVYIFAEQLSGNYEVLSMIFHAVPVKPAMILEGIQNGVGVIKNRKFIAAVCAVATRVKTPIVHWRDALGTKLGYLEISSLPEVVRLKLVNKELVILR